MPFTVARGGQITFRRAGVSEAHQSAMTFFRLGNSRGSNTALIGENVKLILRAY